MMCLYKQNGILHSVLHLPQEEINWAADCVVFWLRLELGSMAQWIKNPSAMQETQEMWVRPLGQEDPLEEKMATHCSTHT